MECTTTPGSSTVMSSTFSSLQTEILFIFRPSPIKTELPCLLYGNVAPKFVPTLPPRGLSHLSMMGVSSRGMSDVYVMLW